MTNASVKNTFAALSVLTVSFALSLGAFAIVAHAQEDGSYDPYAGGYEGSYDPYAGSYDPYAGSYDPYAGSYDPYAGSYDPYAGSYDPYAGSYDPYAGSYDPYAGSYDPYAGSYDPYAGSYDPYAGSYDPYAGSYDPYAGSYDPYCDTCSYDYTPSYDYGYSSGYSGGYSTGGGYTFSAPSTSYPQSRPVTYSVPVQQQQQQQQQQRQNNQPINIVNTNNNVNTNTNTNTNTNVAPVTPVYQTPITYPVQYVYPTYTYPTYNYPTYPTYPTYSTYNNTYCTISASPTSIVNGQAAYLSWSSSGASSAWLSDGIGAVAVSGTLAVRPSVSKMYTLTVSGYGGTNTCNVFVTVSGSYVSLSQIPYTGFDMGPVGNALYWLSLLSFAAAGAYLLVYYKGGAVTLATSMLGSRSLAARSTREVETAETTEAPSFAKATEDKPVETMTPSPIDVMENLPVFESPVAKSETSRTMSTADAMTLVRSKEGDAPRIVITRS